MNDSSGVNQPKRVILHAAATPDDNGDRWGAKEIDKWHRERGWKSIGYHWVLRRSGVWESGRQEYLFGAHCRMGGNTNTLGLCWMGTVNPTDAQLESLVTKAKEIKEKYKIGPDQWFGHYEIDGRKPRCPGFSMDLFRAFLKLKIGE